MRTGKGRLQRNRLRCQIIHRPAPSVPRHETRGPAIGGWGGKVACVSDLDIYRSAQALIKQHSADAPIHAAMPADAMLDKGDLDG